MDVRVNYCYSDHANLWIINLEKIMTDQPATKEEIAHHDKIQEEIAKLITETSRINNENQFRSATFGAFVTLAIIVVVKVYL